MKVPDRVLLFVALALALAAAAPVHGGGAGELSLDRAAITGLLEAALPDPAPIDLPGVPEMTVRVDAPDRVELVDGGVETTLTLTLTEIDWSGSLRVRYVPEVVRPEGIVTLRGVPDRYPGKGILRHGRQDLGEIVTIVLLSRPMRVVDKGIAPVHPA